MGDWWNPFDDDPGTGAWGALGISHPDNPAAKRGTPRAGEGPDKNNYLLGGDPNWVNDFSAGTQATGAAAGQVAQQGQNLSEQGRGLQANANTLTSQAEASQRRGGPATTYDPALAAAQGRNAQRGAGQYGVAQQLVDFANKGPGPSAAQAQLRQGTDEALASNIALARSGSGLGQSALALENAASNASGTISKASNDAAQLRAQEDQAYRGQQLQALGGANEAYGAGRSGDLGLAQQLAQQGQFATGTDLQQRQMNDAQMLGLTNAGLNAQQLSLEGQNMGINAQNAALDRQLAAQGLNLNAAQAQQQGTMGYEQGLTDIYGIDTGEHDKTRELNQAAGQAGIGGVMGLVSSAGSALGGLLSDRRSKKNVRKVDLTSRYARLSRQAEALGV